MLDPKQLKVGSVVRMEFKVGKIKREERCMFHVYQLDGAEEKSSFVFSQAEMQHAELIYTPVSFSREQIAAIKEASVDAFKPGRRFIAIEESWLEEREDKSRLE